MTKTKSHLPFWFWPPLAICGQCLNDDILTYKVISGSSRINWQSATEITRIVVGIERMWSKRDIPSGIKNFCRNAVMNFNRKKINVYSYSAYICLAICLAICLKRCLCAVKEDVQLLLSYNFWEARREAQAFMKVHNLSTHLLPWPALRVC